MKKRIAALVICLVMTLSLLALGASAAATIDQIDIITAYPVAGENPDFTFSVYGQGCRADSSVNTGGFRGGLRWRNVSTGATLGENDVFQANVMYEVSVYLIAESGYAFDVNSTKIQINVEENTSYSYVDSSTDRVLVTLVMVGDAVYLDRVEVTGLDAPAAGKSPDYTLQIPQGVNYRLDPTVSSTQQGGVTWYDVTDFKYIPVNSKFQEGHEYWAEIHLDANANYTFALNTVGYVDGRMIESSGGGESIALVVDFPDVDGNPHTHTPSQWRITQVYHYQVCTTCGELLEEEDHVWSPRYHTVDAKTHAYQCARCKCYDTAKPHIPGPAATQTSPQVCTECEYVIAPALGETNPTETTEATQTTETVETTEATQETTQPTEPAVTVETPEEPQTTEPAATTADPAAGDEGGASNVLLWVLVILGGVLICAAGVLLTVKLMKKS